MNAELNNWLQRGTWFEHKNNKLYYLAEIDPEHQTIVLIHGFPTSSFDFSPIWPLLKEAGYNLITLDMLGFGFSDKPDHRGYSISAQADLFCELLHILGINKAHILAHDYGVSVAQELLTRQQEATSAIQWQSCCFLNGGLFPETHRALLIQKLLLSPLGKYINRLAGYRSFCKSFSSTFGPATQPSEQELQSFWEIINFNQGKHVFHNLITYILDRREQRDRWLKTLQSSEIPLALINGSVDPVSGSHLVDRYSELGCRLDFCTQLADIGHYPHVEHPSRVANDYLNFLSLENL